MKAADPTRWIPSGIAHFDIAGPQFDALRSFYADVLGWSVTPRGPGYAQVTTPQGSPNGAIVEAEEPAFTIGIVVSDLAGALDLARERGGTVAMPPTDNGWVTKAQIIDPAGNRVTLIQG